MTATGGIVSEKYDLPPGNDHWTGVWNASNGNFEGWLVSESVELMAEGIINSAVPAPSKSTSTVWMVNRSVDNGQDIDDSKRVAVPKQPIRSEGIPGFAATDKVVTGNFAYWVSDEGVKASAFKQEDEIPGEHTNLEASRLQVVQAQL